MKKKLNYYNIFMTAMMVVIAGLLLATGIIALQKSMNLKVGVNITPSHEIRIDYGGETIFCNTTKDSTGIKVAGGFTLSGNTLTFTQEFISIGETFALTIYNYNTSYLQVSVSGTGASGNTLTIAPYSTTASSSVLNLTIGAGATEAVLVFEEIITASITLELCDMDAGITYPYTGAITYPNTSVQIEVGRWFVLDEVTNGVGTGYSWEYDFSKYVTISVIWDELETYSIVINARFGSKV